MSPQELEACVLAGLLNGGASPDAFDVIASTPEESFSIGFYRRTFSEIKKQALTSGMIDMLFISEALGGSSLANLSEISRSRSSSVAERQPCKLRARGSIPLTVTRTHCLGPFGHRAGIALLPYCPLVSGFFISGSRESSATCFVDKSNP